jgi:hypothetical protein
MVASEIMTSADRQDRSPGSPNDANAWLFQKIRAPGDFLMNFFRPNERLIIF